MLNRIKSFLAAGFQGADTPTEDGLEPHKVAAAVLMIEAARMDASYGQAERDTIARVLTDQFGLTVEETEGLLADAEAIQDDAVELYRFTRDIKEGMAPEDRVQIIEMLWEVAYADGALHDYEAHLVRRVAGLIYVSDRDRGEARKRVLARLGLADDT